MTEQPIKRQHPTLSDVQIEVDVTDPDPKAAAKQAGDLFDVLRAKYPRENGGAK